MALYAKQTFAAIIDGIEISKAAGDIIDPKLNQRIIDKMKAQGLITARAAKENKEKEEQDD